METLDVLKAAREKLADEKNWTQRVTARDAEGWPVNPKSPDACSWCIVGALIAASPGDIKAARLAGEALKAQLGPGLASSLSFLNDRTSHYQVLTLFDKAIKEQS